MMRILALIVLCLLSFVSLAHADAFAVGAGGEFSQLSLVGANGKTLAAYAGPGLLLDVRYRMGGAQKLGEFGVDVFGLFGTAYDWNSSNSSETCLRTEYGGGLDLRTGPIFVGGQFAKTNATIGYAAVANNATLTLTSLGIRAGINWLVGDHTSLMVGGVYQSGVAYTDQNALSSSQPVSQLGAFVVLHLKLVSDGDHMQTKMSK